MLASGNGVSAFAEAGEVIMWLGQMKFYCTGCGEEITDDIRKLIERRCKDLGMDLMDLGDKAKEAANLLMLRELGEEPPNAKELAFINATALLLVELGFSPTLQCGKCRSGASGGDLHEKVNLRLIKGGKSDE
jgi:hypothetical protein